MAGAILSEISSKVCSKCGLGKSVSEFLWHTKSAGIRRADCRECRRASQSIYHAENKEKISSKKAVQRATNVEFHRERCRRWYHENHDVEKAKRDEWRANNIDRLRAASAAWRSKYPERQRAAEDAYRLANPWIAKVIVANRRARIKANGGVLSRDIVARLQKLQRGRCACCSEPLGDDCHLDHVMPLALGGENKDSNMQLLRAQCNLKKGAKHPIEYMQAKGFLL